MSAPRDNYYYDSYGRVQRKSPSGGDSHSGSSLQEQGRRTILPPLTVAFPTSHSPVSASYPSHYPQQRATPNSYDPNASAYGHYNSYGSAQQQQPSSYGATYQQRSGYSTQQSYGTYQGRTSPPVTGQDHRHLPPLSVPQQAGYYPQSTSHSQMAAMNSVRSPQASYPNAYGAQYPSMQSASYGSTQSPPRGVAHAAPTAHAYQHVPTSHANVERTMNSRSAAAAMPYARGAPALSPTDYDLEPDRGGEPTIKKKRKRADAHQLAVLNDTYNRTAFPSTEERAELARKLDMTARSVQIWFQNKRQSMRQGGRQSTTTSSGSSVNAPAPAPSPQPGYGSSSLVSPTMTGSSGPGYSSRSPPPAIGRSGQSPSPPGGRVDPRKWASRGY